MKVKTVSLYNYYNSLSIFTIVRMMAVIIFTLTFTLTYIQAFKAKDHTNYIHITKITGKKPDIKTFKQSPDKPEVLIRC